MRMPQSVSVTVRQDLVSTVGFGEQSAAATVVSSGTRSQLADAMIAAMTLTTVTRNMESNENKMSGGGRHRASLGVKMWKSSQEWSVRRSAVRSIAWLGVWRDRHIKSLFYSGCRADRNFNRPLTRN